MRTISVRLDEGSEARLERLCQTLGLSQTEVVKAGPVLLQQHSTSPAALAEGLGLIGSFSSAAKEGGTIGPLVAWFDRSDLDHGICAAFFSTAQRCFCIHLAGSHRGLPADPGRRSTTLSLLGVTRWPECCGAEWICPGIEGGLDAAVRRFADRSG